MTTKRARRLFSLLAALICLLSIGCLSGCSSDSAATSSTSEQDSWIGDNAAAELVNGLSMEESGLADEIDTYRLEVADEVGEIDDDTCYIVRALYDLSDGTTYCEANFYVAVDGSQIYTYDLNTDSYVPVWEEDEE